MNATAAWTAAALVLLAVFTAWMDPAAEHFLHAAVLASGSALFLLHANVSFHWLALIPAACAAWAAVQVFSGWTVSSYETWNAASAWLARAVILCLACSGFRNEHRREQCISAIVWFGGAYALLALLGWYSGHGAVLWIFETGHTGEVAATFANRDQYAALIELLLPFALVRALSRPAVPAALCAGIMFASVAASASRAGTLIVTAEVLVILACCRQRVSYRSAALIAASLVVCTLIGGWTYVLERFSYDDPFAYRREMLIATTDMIRARPLTGFGFGAWPAVWPQFAVFDPPGVYMNHAHNDWAEWTADAGIPAALLLAAFAIATAFLARRRVWALGVPAVFLHALVDFPLQKPALACALMFVTGLLVAAARPRNSEWPRPSPPPPRQS